jgi:hypothetical protein
VQPGERWTLWVKRTDVEGARYDLVKHVDPEQLVAELIARWVSDKKLDVEPSLVSLRLVKCGPGKPIPVEEDAAEELDDPSLTLAGAGITRTAWLLAFMAAAPPGECWVNQCPLLPYALTHLPCPRFAVGQPLPRQLTWEGRQSHFCFAAGSMWD